MGEFIFVLNVIEKFENLIFIKVVYFKKVSLINYFIIKIGYYCVIID